MLNSKTRYSEILFLQKLVMSFYIAANIVIESMASQEIPGKELVQSYVMSLFDMEREATIIYDFLEQQGFLDTGIYMANAGALWGGKHDGTTNYYIMFPRSIIVGNQTLKTFFNEYKHLARDNDFHFLLRDAEHMLIDGKELLRSVNPIRKWKPMKRKTREHFGDILKGLNEGKEEKWAYLLKVKEGKDGVGLAKYKFLPYSSLSDEDFEIAEQLYDRTDTYAYKRYANRKDVKVYMSNIGQRVGGYRFATLFVGPKDVLQEVFHDHKKYQYGTRMKEEMKLKPKTRKLFGNILAGLNEEVTSGGIESSARAHARLKRGVVSDHVIIFFTHDQLSGKQNEYVFKPVKKLNAKEREIYKMLVTKGRIDSSYTDEFGLSVFMMTGDEFNVVRDLDYISMYKGDKRDLDALLLKYLKTNKSDNYVERKPIMGKKAEPHFGDIMDNL